MLGKLKISSFQLMCIILIQIIIIDGLLIVFFFKKANFISVNRNKGNIVRNIDLKSGIVKKTPVKNIEIKDITNKDGNPKSTALKDLIAPKQRTVSVTKKKETTQFVNIEKADKNFITNDLVGEMLQGLSYRHKDERDFKLSGYPYMEGVFIATTYDLSYESCEKYPSDPEYGITYSGNKAIKGRTIAVDPEIIPLGSNVYIEFPEKYANLNGWYIAEDIGRKVKGNIIDVFLGESAFKEMKEFGSKRVSVKIEYPDGNNP